MLFQILKRCRTLTLEFLPHLEPGDQLAKVLVASARSAKQGYPRWFRSMLMWKPGGRRKAAAQTGHRDFRANVSAYPMLAGKCVKPGGSVDSIPVQQRDRRHIQLGGSL